VVDVYHHVAMVKHRYHAVWMPGEKLKALGRERRSPTFFSDEYADGSKKL